MAKVRHAVILSRYSGAIIGASAGLAAAICFVVILAGFPHKSVPEMVSSTDYRFLKSSYRTCYSRSYNLIESADSLRGTGNFY